MTAIAGLFGPRSREFLRRSCAAAINAQLRFGRREPAFAELAGAAFGLTLFPTLPEDQCDRQPIVDGRFMLVADVRLDNRDEILRELGEEPSAFRERADADILFLSLRRWNEGTLDRIVGAYAFAFYDCRERWLLLARDPIGERSLCYSADEGLFRFASMPSGVIDRGLPSFDMEAMAVRLASRTGPDGRTSFTGVSTILPGHLMTVSELGCRQTTFWAPDLHSRHASEEEWVGEYRHQLDSAVRASLRTSAPAVASQLSSGYDSSAVATTAARLLAGSRPLLAYTAVPTPGLEQLVPANRIPDESGYAARTAAAYGMQHFTIHDDRSVLQMLSPMTPFFQEPNRHVFNTGWWISIMDAAAKQGAATLLCGSRGNFTISFGGAIILPYLARRGHWLQWWREAKASVSKNRNRWRGVLMASFEPRLPLPITSALRRMFLGAPAPDRFCFVRKELQERARGKRQSLGTSGSGDLHRDQLAWLTLTDPGLALKGYLARTGIEQRDPTADRRLVEFCLSLPPDQLLRDGVYRPLARRALADRVPSEILELPVRGYQGADWYARLDRRDAERMLEDIEASSTATELLDTGKMREAMRDWPVPGRESHDFIFAFGRALTNALGAGIFIADLERNPSQLWS